MKRKIIEVSSDTNIGGAGKCLLTLLKNFDYEKFEVKVILPPQSLLKPQVEALGIEVMEVEGIGEKSFDLAAIKKFWHIFNVEKPDLVHTHGSMSARIAARHAGAKVIYTRHSVFPQPKRLTTFPGKQINGFINNFYSDGIIAVAEAARDNLTEVGVKGDKIRVILNGVDGLAPAGLDELEEIKERFAVADGERVVSIVARLEEVKGHEYFIEAAKMLVDSGVNARFFIAGTGSCEDALKRKVKELKLEDRVVFTGFLEDVDKLLAITDVQVNASYGTEATSLALLEGMSIGVPSVVSDFGGNPGVIKDGINGLVVEKENSAALKKGIETLLGDEELYRKMSKGAIEVFNSTFTAYAMTKNTENYYMEIIERKK